MKGLKRFNTADPFNMRRSSTPNNMESSESKNLQALKSKQVYLKMIKQCRKDRNQGIQRTQNACSSRSGSRTSACMVTNE